MGDDANVKTGEIDSRFFDPYDRGHVGIRHEIGPAFTVPHDA